MNSLQDLCNLKTEIKDGMLGFFLSPEYHFPYKLYYDFNNIEKTHIYIFSVCMKISCLFYSLTFYVFSFHLQLTVLSFEIQRNYII